VWIKKVMDVGVAGLMIPQVNSALDASAPGRRALEDGFTLIAVGAEVTLLAAAVRQVMQELL
jgi:2-keto-3-deoxy-L-rhamnonate aldolase RhmA